MNAEEDYGGFVPIMVSILKPKEFDMSATCVVVRAKTSTDENIL